MVTKKETVTQYVRRKGSVSPNYLYRKFGIKKVNTAINRGSIYSGMTGRVVALRRKK